MKMSNLLKTELIYSAASVNRHPNCIDCDNDLLIFATSRYIAVYNRNCRQIIKLLRSHNDQVSGVQFIRSSDELQKVYNNAGINSIEPNHWIMSLSYDRLAIIWKYEGADDLYKPLYHLEGHEKAVISGHSLWIDKQLFTVTSDMENVTKLWINGIISCTLKTIYMVITSKLATISHLNTKLNFLFLGGSDDNIHVFRISSDSNIVHIIDIIGHSDWVRSIDIIHPLTENFILMASASQDRFVRVWGIHLSSENQNRIGRKTASIVLSEMDNEKTLSLSTTLETVLAGHEGRVYDLKWFRMVHDENKSDGKIRLLSCSSDKSIIIWETTVDKLSSVTTTNDIWQESYRLGEAGECNLGFLGACLSTDSSDIFAYTLNGAIHSWSSTDNTLSSIEWTPVQTIGGHFSPVTDLEWQRDGRYFITSSLDKTCRVHGYIDKLKKWNEISRPQVHGYEINCLAIIDNLRLASGADEKIIRLFEATNFFVKSFKNLTSIDLVEKKSSSKELAAHAQISALGLSTRAIISDETNYNDEENNFECLAELDCAPVEEILIQNTLWPEVQKLYGHSYEIYSVASDATGIYLASASKANKTEFAIINIWNLVTFNKISTLSHHSLTVTRLRYSPNNKYLLSVSRDRTWCLWENELSNNFSKLAYTTNHTTKHSRIIWDCCWTPDSLYFITVSRDRNAIAWDVSSALTEPSDKLTTEKEQSLILEDSIQAVDAHTFIEEKTHELQSIERIYLIAFGLENGMIFLSKFSTLSCQKQNTIFKWSICGMIDSHKMSIRRLSFRPTEASDVNNDDVVLASAGDDCLVSLFKVTQS